MLLTAILPVLMAAAWAAPATEDSSSADLGVIGIDGVEDEEHLTDSPIGDFAPEFEFGYMENRKLERVEYLFGKRVPLDRLVKLNSFEHNYQGEKDVKLTINYPEKGNGSIITYVKVAVIQDAKEGRAYINSGGINQQNISITIESTRPTGFFHYVFLVYGHD